MRIKGTMVITLESGDKVLILLTDDENEQVKLYHHLSIDAYKFKVELSEEEPNIKYISAGFKNNADELIWNDDYIAIPKWYDNN